MQITIGGHHLELTSALRQAVETQFTKLALHYPDLEKIAVTLKLERKIQVAEVNLQYLGNAITCQAEEKDLYKAIGICAKKLAAALAHHKGHKTKDLRAKPQFAEMAQPDS